MRRTEFLSLASALNAVKPQVPTDPDAHRQWRRDCLAIGQMLGAINPFFDKDRFIRNCEGVTDNEG